MKKSELTDKKTVASAPNPEMNSATAQKLRKASFKDSNEVYDMLVRKMG